MKSEIGTIKERLIGRTAELIKDNQMWDAAILLPLVKVDGELSVLFEVRAATLNWQPGDICFPGGKVEANDESLMKAAQREVSEELGISRESVEIIAPLDIFVTQAGPVLHPFLGEIKVPLGELRPNKDEVAEIFTVPLSYLKDVEPRVSFAKAMGRVDEDFPFDLLPKHPKEWRQKRTYIIYFYPYKDKVIWGMTARVLHNFLELIK